LFPISDNAIRRLARKLYGKLVPVKHADGTVTQEEIDIHGFRSCFADWATETLVVTGKPLGDNKTIVTKPLVDASLAHKEGSKTDRAYVRTSLIKERRPLMEAWADYCASETPAFTTSETGAGDGETDPRPTPDDGDDE
jgi:integrase